MGKLWTEVLNMEQKQRSGEPHILLYVLNIGLFGGLFWSLAAYFTSYLNFMKVSPRFILTSWFNAAWIDGKLGFFVSLVIYSLLSVIPAIIYYALFRKYKGMAGGLIYGILLWALLVFLLHPIFKDFPGYGSMNLDTKVTTLCLFLLYGVFIGYSIAYEYEESRKKRKKQAQGEQGTTAG